MGSSLRIDVSEGECLDPRGFCAQTRVVIVAGKGGVGKTTVAATLARLASRAGLSVLILDVEGKRSLASTFGAGALRWEEDVVDQGTAAGAGEIRARSLTPDMALVEYLENHGLRRVSKRLVRTGAIDVVAAAAPGIKDILLLGKVKQLERQGAADLIVLDTPAAGHAVTFLMSARGVLDVVRGGPLRTQAEEVLAMLTDRARCRVMLVTLAEETPANEAVETAFALEDGVGIDLGPVVVNGLYPVIEGLDVDPEVVASGQGVTLDAGEAAMLRAAAAFRSHRQDLQQEQVARLAQALPLPQVHLPSLFTVDSGHSALDRLANAMAAGIAALDKVP